MNTKIQISDVDRRILERVSNITNEDTGVDEDNWVEVDTLLAILDSIEDRYMDLEDRFNDYKEHIEENYKPIGEADNYRFYSKTIEKLQHELDKEYQFIKEKGLEEEYGRY